MPAKFMKGQTFEQLVGVYLKMKYPNDNIVSQPYMCEVVDENGETQYSDRADFYIPSENLIIEVKWGNDTFRINKHYERQQGLLKKGQKYEGICMEENHGLPKEFVSFEKVLRENLNKSKSDTFVVLLTLIEKLAKENDAKTLKAMRNAIFTCFDIEDLDECFNQLNVLSYELNYKDLEFIREWLTENGFDTNPENFSGNIIVISDPDNDFSFDDFKEDEDFYNFDDCDDFDYEEV